MRVSSSSLLTQGTATFLLASFPAAFAQGTGYTQTSRYFQDNFCNGQPLSITSSLQGACQISGTSQNQCQAFTDPVFKSIRTRCLDISTPLNMEGIVQVYVARYQFTGSSTCEGNPTSVEANMADAMCKPYSGTGTNVTQWINVNCNGGLPIYKTCTDAACSKCSTSQYSGKCDANGAGVSSIVKCVYPNRPNSAKPVPDDSTDGASSTQAMGGAFVLSAAVMALLV